MIYEALEIKESPRRWRMCAQDIHERDTNYFSSPVKLCECKDGHDSPKAARECPTAAAALGRLFPSVGAEFRDFGWALQRLRSGEKVFRKGWNGEMYLFLVHPENWTRDGDDGKKLSWICLRTAWGDHVPWFASQIDMLAEDWGTVK